MAEHRFFVPPEALAGSPARVILRGPEHHHLSHVLRLRVGTPVAVFDGEGRGFEGALESISKNESCVTLTAPDLRGVEPAFMLTLAQGIPSHDKMDLIVQKATELGVWDIQPIVAARTTARIAKDAGWKRLERWRRIAREAARQSGRLRVPRVREPASWDDFVAGLAPRAGHGRFLLCPEASSTQRPPFTSPPGGRGEGVVAVGPEGGWNDAEAAAAARYGFHRFALGPRVLRTETAGIVGVALVLAWAGELGETPKKGQDS